VVSDGCLTARVGSEDVQPGYPWGVLAKPCQLWDVQQ